LSTRSRIPRSPAPGRGRSAPRPSSRAESSMAPPSSTTSSRRVWAPAWRAALVTDSCAPGSGASARAARAPPRGASGTSGARPAEIRGHGAERGGEVDAVLLAQRGHHGAHVAERLPGERVGRAAGLAGGTLRGALRRLEVEAQRRQPVAHHVVELARDAQPL